MTIANRCIGLTWAFLFLVGFQLVVPGAAMAQSLGDLIVSPTRVVFEGRTRSAKVSLSNRGSESAVFRISFVEMMMTEGGQLVRVKDPTQAEMVASSMIRYAPRQIEIKPGDTQVIRLSVRRSSDLADGEYRSHLYFRAVPPESSGRSVTEDTGGESGGLQIELIPIFGVSIPIIVRSGELSASAGVADIELGAVPDNT
jgi:P pilus assembly chaperone PapD